MSDLLSMERINALPHPLMIREFSHDMWWPLIDIDVQTGLHRIDVCGMSQTNEISGCAQIMDGDGNIHSAEIFFSDYEADTQ